MRRLYFLFLPVFLFVLWLVLNESLSAGQIALGAALALWFTWAASRLRPLKARPRRDVYKRQAWACWPRSSSRRWWVIA